MCCIVPPRNKSCDIPFITSANYVRIYLQQGHNETYRIYIINSLRVWCIWTLFHYIITTIIVNKHGAQWVYDARHCSVTNIPYMEPCGHGKEKRVVCAPTAELNSPDITVGTLHIYAATLGCAYLAPRRINVCNRNCASKTFTL